MNIKSDISVNIFGVGVDALYLEQRLFVYLQVRYYKEYRDKIKNIVIGIMGKKYLKGRENELILYWFIQRIPLRVVLKGIDNCRDYALRKGMPIFSLKFFERWIDGQFALYKKNFQHTDYTDNGKDPWFYKLFTEQKKGLLVNAVWDPWVGLVPKG
jgi:hypothetical protein